MTNIKKKFLEIINNNSAWILIGAGVLYVVVFFSISFWKYNHFYYNSLDLAIFNQVFYNTAHGRWWQSSIHEPTYLGDHFSPIILPLSLLYAFWQSPLTLLLMLSVIMALSAWPLYLIAKKILGGKIWPLLIGLFWLINPLAQNANLFEFHTLLFGVFFIFWAYYFYLCQKWNYFFWFSFLSLLAREDVSLVVFMLGFLAIIEALTWRSVKKFFVIKDNWQLVTGIIICLLSTVWFFGSLKLIGYYAPESSYKFLMYYSWLGKTMSDIILSLFTQPWQIIKHLMAFGNLEMLLGLLLSVSFLSLWGSRYLILLIGPLTQILLGAPGGSALILSTHYNLLMLPALILSSIYGIKKFISTDIGQKSRWEIVKIITKDKRFVFVIFFIGVFYSNLSLGPLIDFARAVNRHSYNNDLLSIKRDFINQIPASGSVASSYGFLTNLSSRPKVYSMHYGFIGKKELSETDYQIPLDTKYLLIDFDDFLTYQLQFSRHPVYRKFFNSADDKMREFLKHYQLKDIFDNLALFVRSDKEEQSWLYQITDKMPKYQQKIELEDKVDFLGWEINQQAVGRLSADKNLLPISLFWQAKKDLSSGQAEEPSTNYQLKLTISGNDKTVYEKFYPLAYNILPTSDWPINQTVQTNYWFYIPVELQTTGNILQVAIVNVDGHAVLDDFQQTELKYKEKNILGSGVVIGDVGELLRMEK